MRSDLTRGPSASGYVDSRSRECANGDPPCPCAPAPGDNPLGLCDTHLEEYRHRLGLPVPEECPACNPVLVLVRGVFVVVPGAMCFVCGVANGGTVASEAHRREARGKMRARMLTLFAAGDRGPEWVALLARCPEDIRAAFVARLGRVTPSETASK